MSVRTKTWMTVIELVLGILAAAVVLAWFIHGLTRPRDMREDQYREDGEFDGHKVVKDWHKEK